MYVALFMLGSIVICQLEDVPIMPAMFETASAIGTVGLSLGITPGLCTVSKVVLISLMYFGRVGGLTLIFAAASGIQKSVQSIRLKRLRLAKRFKETQMCRNQSGTAAFCNFAA